jgi:hypothetical protein
VSKWAQVNNELARDGRDGEPANHGVNFNPETRVSNSNYTKRYAVSEWLGGIGSDDEVGQIHFRMIEARD